MNLLPEIQKLVFLEVAKTQANQMDGLEKINPRAVS
jgi:hypothetical protein